MEHAFSKGMRCDSTRGLPRALTPGKAPQLTRADRSPLINHLICTRSHISTARHFGEFAIASWFFRSKIKHNHNNYRDHNKKMHMQMQIYTDAVREMKQKWGRTVTTAFSSENCVKWDFKPKGALESLLIIKKRADGKKTTENPNICCFLSRSKLCWTAAFKCFNKVGFFCRDQMNYKFPNWC